MELRAASRLELWLRRARLATLQARRFGRWALTDAYLAPARVAPDGPIVHRVRVPIARRGADPRLEAGKRHNVRLAASALRGAVIAADRPLSFWRAVGPATEARGYAWGMELRSGCAVPAIGGGMCVLSNALFTLAVDLGWVIHERHGHSIALGDPEALDATVAFPHVDLRVGPRSGTAVLDACVHGDVLVLAVRYDGPRLRIELERAQRADARVRETRIRRRVWRELELLEDRVIVDDRQRIAQAVRTCLDCGETACRARVELPTHGVDR